MRSSCVAASLVLGLAVPVLGATPALAGSSWFTGEVEHIIDGDSILVDLDDGPTVEVRLIGVDADEGGECFYEEAKDHAEEELLGESVELRLDRRHDESDELRLFAYVWEDDELFNLEHVRQGYARERSYGEDYKLRSDFLEAEEEARADGEGLWSACSS